MDVIQTFIADLEAVFPQMIVAKHPFEDTLHGVIELIKETCDERDTSADMLQAIDYSTSRLVAQLTEICPSLDISRNKFVTLNLP